MGMRARALGVTVGLLIMTFSVLITIVPTASALSRTWTTDGDWTEPQSVFIGVEVVGTGIPAKVELIRDDTDWVNENPPSPPGWRESPSVAFSSYDNVTVLFGGYDNGTYLDETWEYDWVANTWTQITPPLSPAGRQSAGMSYDPVEQVIVLFGGFNDIDFLTDTWEYDVTTNTWAETTPATSPPQMVDTPLAYVSTQARHLVTGQDLLAGQWRTWAYDAALDTWTNRNPGSNPGLRSGFAIAFHPVLQRVVLFGGSQLTTLFADTWEYNWGGNSWTQITAPGPDARAGHMMTYRPSSSEVLLFGGTTSGGITSDTWAYSPSRSWTSLSTPTAPPGRRNGGFTYDTGADRGILYGGVSGTGQRLGDTWSLGAAYRSVGRYSSGVFDAGGANVVWQNLWWNKTSQPAGTTLEFQIATSDVNPPPTGWNFLGPGGGSGHYTTPGAAIWSGHNNQRFFRFLADFTSSDSQSTSSMEDVTVVFDTPPAPPYIQSEDPACPAFGVPQNKVLRIEFSEGMDTSTVVVTPITGVPNVTFTYIWSSGDSILDLPHTPDFGENQVYRFWIAGRDKQGEALVTTTTPGVCDGTVTEPWIFVTERINPTIINTDPDLNQLDWPTTSPIVVDFSEPMNRPTVTWTINPNVPLSESWTNGDARLLLTPSPPLLQCTAFTVEITGGQDLAGAPLVPGSTPNPWSFVSACVNPYIDSTSPTNFSTNVPVNSPIVVTFIEPMNPTSVTETLLRGVPVTFSRTWTNGNRILTLTHSQNFPICTVYEVLIQGNDVDGNPLIPNPVQPSVTNPWTFVTTCDNPFIMQTDPDDGAIDVPVVTPIVIDFSEQMNEGSVQWTISPVTTELGFNWQASVRLTVNYFAFQQCTDYTFTVTQGTDLAGNPLIDGIAPNPFTFSTVCTAPYVVSTDPANGDVLVPLTKAITVVFSEPMDTPTVVVGILPTIALSRTWSNGDRTLTLTHSVDFDNCTTYQVALDGLDLAGESLQSPGPGAPNVFSFTTICIVPEPYITRTDPIHQSTNIPLTRSIVVEFSEAINIASFQVTINPFVATSRSWANGDTQVTLAHTDPFPECTLHTVTVSAMDVDGNGLINVTGSKPNPWTFTTTCVPPQIASTIPISGATNVPQNALIIVNFTEAMDRNSITVSILPIATFSRAWSNGDQTLTLTPVTPLQPGLNTVTIGGNDADGVPLVPGPVPNPWSFTVQAGVPAPRNLQVFRQNPDILLTWNAVAGASRYRVYSSPDRFATFPTGWSLRGQPTGTSFFLVGDDNSGSTTFYLVRAEDSVGVLSPNSTMGVKLHLIFPFSTTRSNANWVSLPYHNRYRQASDISSDLEVGPNIDVVGKWNPATQTTILWYLFRGTWRGVNFPIAAGDAIMIGARAAFAWKINGTDAPVSLSFTAYPGPSQNYNWIALPPTSSYRQASDIVLAIEGGLGTGRNTKIVEVGLWDRATQTLVRFFYTPSGWNGGTNFAIAPGDGIYLKVVSDFSWTPALVTPEVP